MSSVATNLVLLLLVPQCSCCSLVSDGNEDGEKKVLAGSVDQVIPVDGGQCKEINASLWRSFQNVLYQIITHYIDQPVAIRQGVTGQVEPNNIFCNVQTCVSTSHTSQVPTVPRV